MSSDKLKTTRLDILKATPSVWADILRNGDLGDRVLVLTEIVLLVVILFFVTWGVSIAF